MSDIQMPVEQIERRIELLHKLLNGTISSRRNKTAIAAYITGVEQANPYKRVERRQRHFERYMDTLCARTNSSWRG